MLFVLWFLGLLYPAIVVLILQMKGWPYKAPFVGVVAWGFLLRILHQEEILVAHWSIWVLLAYSPLILALFIPKRREPRSE